MYFGAREGKKGGGGQSGICRVGEGFDRGSIIFFKQKRACVFRLGGGGSSSCNKAATDPSIRSRQLTLCIVSRYTLITENICTLAFRYLYFQFHWEFHIGRLAEAHTTTRTRSIYRNFFLRAHTNSHASALLLLSRVDMLKFWCSQY